MTRIRSAGAAMVTVAATIAVATPAAAAPPPIADYFLMHGGPDGARLLADSYHSNTLPDPFSISVETFNTESVEFFVNDRRVQLENNAPYFIGGDNAGDWGPYPFSLGAGDHEITAIAYSEDNAQGEASEPLTTTVRIIKAEQFNPDFDAPNIEPDAGVGIPSEPPLEGLDTDPIGLTYPDADIRVNTPVDAADANPGDGVCEADLSSARRCTLRAAIEEANAGDADTIAVPNLSQNYELELGQLLITGRVTLLGIDQPVIDAKGRSRVLTIENSPISLIQDLTLTNGEADFGDFGGVVKVNESVAWFHGVEVSNGVASNGGGLWVRGASIVRFEQGTIRNNQGGFGALTFRDGAGINQNGGGMLITRDATVSIVRSSVVDNLAVRGGGIDVQPGGTLNLLDSSILDNDARVQGGGIRVSRDAVVLINSTTIAGNLAATAPGLNDREHRRGAGFYSHSQDVRMSGTIIAANTVVNPRPGEDTAPDCSTVQATNYRAPIQSGRGNLIGITDGCEWVDIQDGSNRGVLGGTIDSPVDAGLLPRAELPLPHRALRSDSPALGLGDDTLARVGQQCDITDQFGDHRDDSPCDSGAVQLRS